MSECPEYAKADWEAKTEVERNIIRTLHEHDTPYQACTQCADVARQIIAALDVAGYRVVPKN